MCWSDSWERARQSLSLLASYLEAAEFELEVLLLVEELLEPVGEDDVSVVEAAVFLVELIVLVIFDVRGHRVVLHHCCGPVGRGIDHSTVVGSL